MIDDTQLEHWKTKAEASEILKCSEKTISRLAAQKRIQKLMRRNPGRRAQPVFSPDDIEALRGDQDQIEAFPVATERNAPGTALARRTQPSPRSGCWLNCWPIDSHQSLVCLWSGRFC